MSKIESLDLRRNEKRMVTDIPGIDRPGANMLQIYGLGDVTLPSVTIDSALTVPAVLAAVAFLSRSLAALPLYAYRMKGDKAEMIKGGLQTLIHEAPNKDWPAFKLRQYFWQQVFTGGRGLLWIDRAGTNIVGLYRINPAKVKITCDAMGRMDYEVDGKHYPASDVIDVPFMLKADGVSHYGPVMLGTKAIQLALAMNDYGSRFFAGGGVPPLAMEGPMPEGAEAMKRAMADVHRAIDSAKAQDKPIFPMPPGHKLTPVGFDPEKGQMTNARRFSVEEIARVFQIPPTFLQDLTHGTLSNTEQEDLRLVKHLLGQWVEAFEQELNLKLFGQRNGGRYVRHNMDGVLRGDFKTRSDAVAALVHCGVYTPNIGAKYMGQDPHEDPNADKLYMQGATLPLDKLGETIAPPETNEVTGNEI